MVKPKYNKIVISGGSVKGFAALGALQYVKDNGMLDEVKTYIRESVNAMKLILSDISKNKADINKCPKTDNTWRCRNCKFQEICQ